MTIYFPEPMTPERVRATIASHFDGSDAKPIYAALHVRTGEILTWATSKRGLLRELDRKSWEPADYRPVKIANA